MSLLCRRLIRGDLMEDKKLPVIDLAKVMNSSIQVLDLREPLILWKNFSRASKASRFWTQFRSGYSLGSYF